MHSAVDSTEVDIMFNFLLISTTAITRIKEIVTRYSLILFNNKAFCHSCVLGTN